MRYRLPSLNALRAFEAAGRCGSLSAAAQDLGVTVGAVSRHITLLEGHFGAALLERHRSGVRPTAAGATYLQAVAKAFDEIDAASAVLAGGIGNSAPLRLYFYSSFATEWLAPRLPAFRAEHPDIAFELILSKDEIDWNGDFDLAMTATPPSGNEFHYDRLFETLFSLVCAPPTQTAARAFDEQTLLIAPRERAVWPIVLDTLVAGNIERHNIVRFESLSLTYQAARRGGGIALGNLFIVMDDLISQRLAMPIKRVVSFDLPHYIVCRRARLANPALTIFRNWLIEQADVTNLAMATLLRDHEDIPVSL